MLLTCKARHFLVLIVSFMQNEGLALAVCERETILNYPWVSSSIKGGQCTSVWLQPHCSYVKKTKMYSLLVLSITSSWRCIAFARNASTYWYIKNKELSLSKWYPLVQNPDRTNSNTRVLIWFTPFFYFYRIMCPRAPHNQEGPQALL